MGYIRYTSKEVMNALVSSGIYKEGKQIAFFSEEIELYASRVRKIQDSALSLVAPEAHSLVRISFLEEDDDVCTREITFSLPQEKLHYLVSPSLALTLVYKRALDEMLKNVHHGCSNQRYMELLKRLEELRLRKE